MNWWLIITLVVAGALAYGYWSHQRERRRLAGIFGQLAVEYGGEVKPGNWLVHPQLRFEVKDRHYLVTAMATDGADSGESGPFTLVNLELSFDTGRKIRVKRGRSVTRRLTDSIAPGRNPTTGHKEFDEAFQIKGSDPVFASSLLAAGVRQKLQASRLPRLDLHA